MNQHAIDPKTLKPRSLKLKMALWYTFILLMICIVFMSVILSIYRSAERKTAISTLEKIVDDTALNSSKTDTLINGTSDYSAFIADDVQLMIYDENGEHVAGFFYPELNSLPLTSDTVPARTELGGNSYYYINRLVKNSTNAYYIRGIIAAENDLTEMIKSHREILALTSPSYLVRNRTLGPPLENNPEIPPSSRLDTMNIEMHISFLISVFVFFS